MGSFRHASFRYWGVALLFVSSLLYLLFQGGKLAFMLFIIVAVLCLYVTLGRWSGVSRLKGVRTLPGVEHGAVIQAGASLAVSIQLHVPGYWPIPFVKVRDRLVSRDGGEQVIQTLGIPNWRRQLQVTYQTPPLPRGFYQFDDTECTTGDIFGLFKHKGRLGMPYAFAVLPQKVHIREWKQLHRMFRGVHPSSTQTRFHRETLQTSGVREFVNGDRLSRIHWNATAKTGTWKSKEFERESLPRIILVLDRSRQGYGGKEHFELAVSTAASLLDYAVSCHLASGMLSAGKKPLYFEPKPGASHQKAITDHLIEVEPDGTSRLLDVLIDQEKVLKPGSYLIVISPQSAEELAPLFPWVHRRGMKTCHIWITQDMQPADRDKWNGHWRKAGVLGYAVTSLDELAPAVGGRD